MCARFRVFRFTTWLLPCRLLPVFCYLLLQSDGLPTGGGRLEGMRRRKPEERRRVLPYILNCKSECGGFPPIRCCRSFLDYCATHMNNFSIAESAFGATYSPAGNSLPLLGAQRDSHRGFVVVAVGGPFSHFR